MITRLRHGFAVAALSIVCMLMGVFTSFAANSNGELDPINGSVISGWAVDTDNPDKSASVVLYVYTDGTTEAKELARVTADQYRSDLKDSLGNGNHAFSYTVNWDSLEGSSFIIEGYVETASGKNRIYGSPQYSKKETAKADVKSTSNGPAGDNGTPAPASSAKGTKGAYLGKFQTTAYCNCSQCCSGGHKLTYSGTVPTANHTVSADINRYPLGTKLMIGDTVYTVEDIGTNVVDNKLDIYFDTHQQALDYGLQTVDVYAVD